MNLKPTHILLASLTLLLAACQQSPATPQASAPASGDTLSGAGGADLLTPLAVTPSTLTVGATQQLNVLVNGAAPTPGQLVWTSSNPAVATVSQGGLVTATGAGSVTIRVALSARRSVGLDFPFTVTAASAPAPTPTPTPTPGTGGTGGSGSGGSSAFAQQVLALTNAARAQGQSCGGVAYPSAPALTYNAQLEQAAQAHAADMASKNYFSHTSQDGRTFDQRISATGYPWRQIAENIAAGNQTPDAVVKGWLASTGHCQNIMNASLKELGVGYAASASSSYGTYWVQDFGTR